MADEYNSSHTGEEIDAAITAVANKVDKVTGKGLSTNDYTTAEKNKLSSVAENANNYAHPLTHSADIITDGTINKAYTATEKTKLSGIAEGANNYTHPANHSPSIITQDENNRFVSDAEKAIWNGYTAAGVLTENTTVNFNAAMTAAEIQALINAQPKNLGGYTLTFQFADGSYTLNAVLRFYNFFGGTLNIYGNTGESSVLYNTQSVILVTTGGQGIDVRNCRVGGTIRNIKHTLATAGGTYQVIYVGNSSMIFIDYCYLIAAGTGSGDGGCISGSDGASIRARHNYVTSGYTSISSSVNANIQSQNNVTTGTQAIYGLQATSGGVITKRDTQPTGSTGAESTAYGGEIR